MRVPGKTGPSSQDFPGLRRKRSGGTALNPSLGIETAGSEGRKGRVMDPAGEERPRDQGSATLGAGRGVGRVG